MKLFVLLLATVAQGFVLPLDDRIINGEKVDIKNYPYQVSFRSRDHHICGGSILNEKTVLTAAHCVHGKDQSSFSVRVGNSKNKLGELHKVSKVYKHEKYDPKTIDYDVAVVKLATPLKYSSKVKPIKLHKKEPSTGSKAVITGWGTTDPNTFFDLASPELRKASPDLRKANLSFLTSKDCKKKFSSGKITDRMVCGYDKVEDVCKGDSGGPLVVDGKQVGIASWVNGCANPKYPSVFGSVPSLRSWIEKHL